MSTYDNGCVDTPDWAPDPRCCPFEACDVCGDNTKPTAGFGVYPPNVVLGDN